MAAVIRLRPERGTFGSQRCGRASPGDGRTRRAVGSCWSRPCSARHGSAEAMWDRTAIAEWTGGARFGRVPARHAIGRSTVASLRGITDGRTAPASISVSLETGRADRSTRTRSTPTARRRPARRLHIEAEWAEDVSRRSTQIGKIYQLFRKKFRTSRRGGPKLKPALLSRTVPRSSLTTQETRFLKVSS
jgi:hypothetical protein